MLKNNPAKLSDVWEDFLLGGVIFDFVVCDEAPYISKKASFCSAPLNPDMDLGGF